MASHTFSIPKRAWEEVGDMKYLRGAGLGTGKAPCSICVKPGTQGINCTDFGIPNLLTINDAFVGMGDQDYAIDATENLGWTHQTISVHKYWDGHLRVADWPTPFSVFNSAAGCYWEKDSYGAYFTGQRRVEQLLAGGAGIDNVYGPPHDGPPWDEVFAQTRPYARGVVTMQGPAFGDTYGLRFVFSYGYTHWDDMYTICLESDHAAYNDYWYTGPNGFFNPPVSWTNPTAGWTAEDLDFSPNDSVNKRRQPTLQQSSITYEMVPFDWKTASDWIQYFQNNSSIVVPILPVAPVHTGPYTYPNSVTLTWQPTA